MTATKRFRVCSFIGHCLTIAGAACVGVIIGKHEQGWWIFALAGAVAVGYSLWNALRLGRGPTAKVPPVTISGSGLPYFCPTVLFRCDCGGAMRLAQLDRFDFTAMAGYPSEIVDVTGLRCDNPLCGYETITGYTINGALCKLADTLGQQPLTPASACFLRKQWVLEQQVLDHQSESPRC